MNDFPSFIHVSCVPSSIWERIFGPQLTKTEAARTVRFLIRSYENFEYDGVLYTTPTRGGVLARVYTVDFSLTKYLPDYHHNYTVKYGRPVCIISRVLSSVRSCRSDLVATIPNLTIRGLNFAVEFPPQGYQSVSPMDSLRQLFLGYFNL